MSRWDGIDEFLAVAAAMSFTGGARALGMSTTHVSRAVIKLEQRLDRQLFHRTTRKVGLTDAGRAFLERCERIAQDTEEAFDLMNERGEPRGLLPGRTNSLFGRSILSGVIWLPMYTSSWRACAAACETPLTLRQALGTLGVGQLPSRGWPDHEAIRSGGRAHTAPRRFTFGVMSACRRLRCSANSACLLRSATHSSVCLAIVLERLTIEGVSLLTWPPFPYFSSDAL